MTDPLKYPHGQLPVEKSCAETEGGAGRPESDRHRVRRLLIEPLLAMGLRKQRRHSAEEQEALFDRLEARCGYLADGQLEALAEAVRRGAHGEARNVWPDEVSILNWAAALEPPPDVESRLVTSYLASRAGRTAWDEAPALAVVLRRHLKRAGCPPVPYDWVEFRSKARELVREEQRQRVLEAERGASDWLEAWLAEVERVRVLVFGEAA